MGDEEAEFKVEYLDAPADEEPLVTNWLSRPGKAKVTYPDGATYEGTFDGERMKTGEATYTWVKPAEEEGDEPVPMATFKGDYADGKRSGVGTMVYPNGDEYTGEWVANVMVGEGTYKYKATGDIYSGTWVAGKKDGAGIYQFGADSSMLKGLWKAGEVVEGEWVFQDGTVYKGTFQDGKPTGAGTFTFPSSGIKQKGAYVAKPKEEDADEDEPPVMEWKGESVVAC